MNKSSGIPIRNIYYMLTYAWENFKVEDETKVGKETFENIYNLLGKVFYSGLIQLVKRGFHREYIFDSQETRFIKGKIDFNDSIRNNFQVSRRISCTFDDYSKNVEFNGILKYTLKILLRSPSLDQDIKRDLRKLNPVFLGIKSVEPTRMIRSRLTYSRNNIHYMLLMNICVLIYEGLITKEKDDELVFSDFINEDSLSHLYEKFILNFYKKHLPSKSYYVHSPIIKWNIDEDRISSDLNFLPDMRTDITIENKFEESQLIIDTKFYLSALRSNYRGEGKKHVSHNLYQIFAYINNSEFEGVKRGMLLYPTVETEIDSMYWINGKKIEVKTVNLDEEWDEIEERLLSIIL